MCPFCSYELGAVNSYSVPLSSTLIPAEPSQFSYLTFESLFSLNQKLPFHMQGDCPVVLTSILSTLQIDHDSFEREGRLTDVIGPMGGWLHAFGLYPAVGDVVIAVNGIAVSQLNASQLKRFIKRIRKGISQYGLTGNASSFSITFRRHYLEVSRILL
jgi:hypothetical protein